MVYYKAIANWYTAIFQCLEQCLKYNESSNNILIEKEMDKE